MHVYKPVNYILFLNCFSKPMFIPIPSLNHVQLLTHLSLVPIQAKLPTPPIVNFFSNLNIYLRDPVYYISLSLY